MTRKKRTKSLISILLTAAVLTAPISPVMAEEINEDVTPPDFLTELESTGFNTSESASTYCGVIFVRDDGLFDKMQGGNRISVNGLSFNASTHTLYLNNVNIGEVYDAPLSHEKMGTLVFCCEDREETDYYGRI